MLAAQRMKKDNVQAQQPAGRGGQNVAQRRAAVPVCCWFSLTVAPVRVRFGFYQPVNSSPDGPYIPGTGMLFKRR